MRSLIALIFLLLVSQISFSQQGTFTQISDITQSNHTLTKFSLPDHESNSLIKNLPQIFLFHKNNLFAQPDGTGRMYKIDTLLNKFRLIRQDSTIYFGSTFGSYLFSYNDSIYSFGGYGYWKYNGHLRVFIPEKGEWELEGLNREIPFAKGHTIVAPIWYSPNTNELWIGYSINSGEGLKQSKVTSNDSVYVLNLENKKWETKGHLTNEIKILLNSLSIRPLASGSWGQMIHLAESNEIIMLDYRNNTLLNLEGAKANRILRLLSTNSINHFVDSNLVIQSGKNWLRGNFLKGDTLKLSKSDFVNSGQVIYTPIQKAIVINAAKKIDPYQLLIIGVVIGVVISIVVYQLIEIKNSKEKKQISHKNEIDFQKNLFDDKERDVLELIKSNSKNGVGTTIDQINRLIGVNLKNSDIQKKQRSDVFLSINDKWKRHSQSQQLLIDKKRLDSDKRIYEYYIEAHNLDKI